jgi:hypothetical protein
LALNFCSSQRLRVKASHSWDLCNWFVLTVHCVNIYWIHEWGLQMPKFIVVVD